MKGTLYEVPYGWVVRYTTEEGTKRHIQIHPADAKYLFSSDNGKEIDFDTALCTDEKHRPGKEKTVLYAILSYCDNNE